MFSHDVQQLIGVAHAVDGTHGPPWFHKQIADRRLFSRSLEHAPAVGVNDVKPSPWLAEGAHAKGGQSFPRLSQ